MMKRGYDPRRRSQAFSLIEMIIVIGLLTAFGLLMAPLFANTMKLNRQTGMAYGSLSQFDMVLGRMRQDTWHATATAAPDGHTLDLQLPDGSTVRWAISEDGNLTRTVTGGPTTEPPAAWSHWPYRMTFAASGSAVTVDVLAADSTIPAHHVLTSQVLLSRRMQP